jgi:hypothetical protein
MPDLSGNTIPAREPYDLLGEEIVNGHMCHHLRADWRKDCFIEIWLDLENLAIRKLADAFTSTPEDYRTATAALQTVGQPELAALVEKCTPGQITSVIEYAEVVFDGEINDEDLLFKEENPH